MGRYSSELISCHRLDNSKRLGMESSLEAFRSTGMQGNFAVQDHFLELGVANLDGFGVHDVESVPPLLVSHLSLLQLVRLKVSFPLCFYVDDQILLDDIEVSTVGSWLPVFVGIRDLPRGSCGDLIQYNEFDARAFCLYHPEQLACGPECVAVILSVVCSSMTWLAEPMMVLACRALLASFAMEMCVWYLKKFAMLWANYSDLVICAHIDGFGVIVFGSMNSACVLNEGVGGFPLVVASCLTAAFNAAEEKMMLGLLVKFAMNWADDNDRRVSVLVLHLGVVELITMGLDSSTDEFINIQRDFLFSGLQRTSGACTGVMILWLLKKFAMNWADNGYGSLAVRIDHLGVIVFVAVKGACLGDKSLCCNLHITLNSSV